MIKKRDIILILVLLLIAAVGMLLVNRFQKDEGASVIITIDGDVFGQYSLDVDQVIDVDQADGHNQVVISDGQVMMAEADCPDLYCVQHARIHYDHETIICLPHKLVVEITGGEEQEVDMVTQ